MLERTICSGEQWWNHVIYDSVLLCLRAHNIFVVQRMEFICESVNCFPSHFDTVEISLKSFNKGWHFESFSTLPCLFELILNLRFFCVTLIWRYLEYLHPQSIQYSIFLLTIQSPIITRSDIVFRYHFCVTFFIHCRMPLISLMEICLQ